MPILWAPSCLDSSSLLSLDHLCFRLLGQLLVVGWPKAGGMFVKCYIYQVDMSKT
ncbi:hypothetical protein D0Y65_040635 [Glycine soja]|uniref:Uncharacterized protein n=1 Tax=Glycine soja TaxID=3848 RepID=A0A445GS66_GLYSO|nr:hypothetical protein D0Y65_040635 [Glycine soja]